MVEVREIDYLHLAAYKAVPKFKGVMGDMRRGHVYSYGAMYPKRPFGNTNTKENRIKSHIYEQLRNSRRTI